MFGLFSKSAKIAAEVAYEDREKLNIINRKIDETAQNASEALESSQDSLEYSLSELIELKDTIYQTSLKRFVKCVKGIRNIEIPPEYNDFFHFGRINLQITDYKKNEVIIDHQKCEMTTKVLSCIPILGPSISFLSSLIDSVKTSFKIDEANAELAKVEAQAEILLMKSSAIDTIVEFYDLAFHTITALDSLFSQELLCISHIKQKYGKNYKKYPIEIKQQLRVVFNLAHGIYSLLKFEYINHDGLPNRKFLLAYNNVFMCDSDYEYDYETVCYALDELEEYSDYDEIEEYDDYEKDFYE